MAEISTVQSISVLIVSILIAALMVRIIFVIFDGISVLVEEVFDDDNNIPFDRSSYYILNAVLVTSLCLFFLILIYEAYVVGYIDQIPVEKMNTTNPHPVLIASAAFDPSHEISHDVGVGENDGGDGR